MQIFIDEIATKSSIFNQLNLFWRLFLEENCTTDAQLLAVKGLQSKTRVLHWRAAVCVRNSQQGPVAGMPAEQAPDVVPSLSSYPSAAARPMQTTDHMSLAAHGTKGDYRDASGFSTTDLYHMGNRSLSQDMYTPYNQASAGIKYPSHTSPSTMGINQQSPAPAMGPLGLRRSPAAQTTGPTGWGQQGGYVRNDVSAQGGLSL